MPLGPQAASGMTVDTAMKTLAQEISEAAEAGSAVQVRARVAEGNAAQVLLDAAKDADLPGLANPP